MILFQINFEIKTVVVGKSYAPELLKMNVLVNMWIKVVKKGTKAILWRLFSVSTAEISKIAKIITL